MWGGVASIRSREVLTLSGPLEVDSQPISALSQLGLPFRGEMREVQIKTTIRYQLTLVRMAIIQKSTNSNAGEGMEKKEPCHAVGGNVSWCSHYG